MLAGYIYGIFYIIALAISTIWLNQIGQHIAIPVFLFYSSLSAVLILNVLNFKNIKYSHLNIGLSLNPWLIMSAALIFVWYFTYYCTIHSSADYFIATLFVSTALITAVRELKKLSIITCVLVIFLIYIFSYHSSPLALLTAILASISGYIYYRASYQFSKKTNLSALSVLSVRFYFVVLFAAFYTYSYGGIPAFKITPHEIAILAIFSLVNMVIPTFLSQSSLQIIGVSRMTFMNTLVPVLTFILEAGFQNQWHTGMFFACLCATLVLNLESLKKLIMLVSARQQRL